MGGAWGPVETCGDLWGPMGTYLGTYMGTYMGTYIIWGPIWGPIHGDLRGTLPPGTPWGGTRTGTARRPGSRTHSSPAAGLPSSHAPRRPCLLPVGNRRPCLVQRGVIQMVPLPGRRPKPHRHGERGCWGRARSCISSALPASRAGGCRPPRPRGDLARASCDAVGRRA